MLLYIGAVLRHSDVLSRSSDRAVFGFRWNDIHLKNMPNICRYNFNILTFNKSIDTRD